ncbi:superinfection immunity protein [Azospirillum sp. INR13]|uniref:superinfection immunity protein n=1 Tax=Azospirillum sp. INR13 TaxID=2596919 RepID=UPI001892525F|nr:superinfection immunity protein [Azospirillum sp. INR13]MBF5094709.1 superinfection immunity protein [Azospirillum sp. INR13]
MDLIGAILGFGIALVLYLIPTWIAAARNHSSAAGVFVINLFLGWTFLGWVVALAWSVSGQHPASNIPKS